MTTTIRSALYIACAALLIFVVLAASINGCAHLPDAKIGYYLAKSEIKFKVVRTITCDANNNPIVVNASTPSVTHSADPGEYHEINLAKLKGRFSDSDVKFDFYEDGRLKSINASNTGQGETILKTTVSIGAAGLAMKKETYEEPCDFIRSAGGGKPLTLTYEGVVDVSKDVGERQEIRPDITSSFYESRLRNTINGIYAVVEGFVAPNEAPVNFEAQNGDVVLKARQPGLVKIKVGASGTNAQIEPIWEGELAVSQFGKDYVIPLPAPAAFGKQVVAMTFQESGALTSLQYVNNNSTGQVLNVVNSSLTEMQGETAAEKAANVKAEADLIAQQQRLARCLADPTNCQ